MFPEGCRPYLTLRFLVCPQILRDFHSQILSLCLCGCVFMFLENDPLVLSSLVREEVSKILHWEAVRRSWGHGLIPECTFVILNVDRIR